MPGRFRVINRFKEWKKGDLPGNPTVIIALNEWATEDSIVTISESLASDSEIDFRVDQLKNDLEMVRKEAKRILKSQIEKIQTSIGK